jgi:hypothetical protein
MTPEIRERIDVLRSKQSQGTITLDECKEVIVLLRQGRITVAATEKKSTRPKANTATVNVEDDDL